MTGDPAQFETIGNRLGFAIVEESPDKLKLLWRGPRFPAFLCLGIALLLLVVSVPILEALRQRGFVGPAGSLWYFPVMNLVLFGIALFLITQRRVIEFDNLQRRLSLRRQSLYRSRILTLRYDEICEVRLGIDEIESGFAIGGSTAAQKFPIPALRVSFAGTGNVLLDRSSHKKLASLAKQISRRIAKPLFIDPQFES